MATPIIESAWVTGEISPALFGNVALARMHSAAATCRNFFVSFQGGAYSRAGTAFVGFSKQTGRLYPPRLITFQFSINQGLALEFGNFYMRVIFEGAYVTENPIAITGASNSNPIILTVANNFSNGDWVFITGMNGMTELNGQTFVINSVTPFTFSLQDIYGNLINSTSFPAWTGGGTVARIYTLSTIYAEQDLKWLKFTQSADVMSLCCINQISGTEYKAQDLSRFSDTNWVFTPVVATPTINPPTGVSGSATTSGTTFYAYEITAVNPNDGTESVASQIVNITSAVDISATAGTITINWGAVKNTQVYNIYKAFPVFMAGVPVGALYGFAGQAFGQTFTDSNIVPDTAQVPPIFQNPFARGQVLAVNPTAGGSGYSGAVTVTINTSTGSGAQITPILGSGALTGVITGYFIVNPGHDYASTDTVTISGGGGSGATATLSISPDSGTYPGVVAYFQERRAYAYTLNQPDTAFLSQPGSFTNFDVRIPTIDSDAITTSPWTVEVNGVQFMIPVTGGLMVLTGLEAYFLAGAGSSPFTPTPLTPSSQSALPQGFNGCSPTVPPIRIYQDVVYVQAKGSTYRDFSFDISQYTYTGVDLTSNSTHLFRNFTILEHAWCEEPYRVLWAVRSDGILLSLTWDKHEKVSGWARHDTNGLFQSVCSVTEPPVDALYTAVQRVIGGQTAYIVERFDNRLWASVEDAWCVDCGFSLPQTEPNSTLSANSATGLGALTGVTNLIGGTNYSAATTFIVTDAPTAPNGPLGPGTGAVATGTIVGGVITGINFISQGVNYLNPQIAAVDPAGSAGGSGFAAVVVLNNTMTFTASAAVFGLGNVGSVIRMGGGVATITAFTSSTIVTANITSPIVATYDDGNSSVIPQQSGTWTMTAPVTTVGGLGALNGATVTGLADGVAIPPTVVASGQITLPNPASQITIGLGFQARLQSVYLDAGEPTAQGSRKKVAEVTARVEASGPFLIGSNQPDGSTLSPIQIAPPWKNLAVAPVPTIAAYNSKTVPLFTGDIRVPVSGGWQTPGQIAIQQDLPYPINVLALIPEDLAADSPSQAWPQKQQGRGR